MCEGFGCLVTKTGEIYTTVPKEGGSDISHSDIIKALRWVDLEDKSMTEAQVFTRRWVRVECAYWTPTSFSYDEIPRLPGWASNDTDAIRDKVAKVMKKYLKAYRWYLKRLLTLRDQYQKSASMTPRQMEQKALPIYNEFIERLRAIGGLQVVVSKSRRDLYRDGFAARMILKDLS